MRGGKWSEAGEIENVGRVVNRWWWGAAAGEEVSGGVGHGFTAEWRAVLIPMGKNRVGRTPPAISKSPQDAFRLTSMGACAHRRSYVRVD